MRQQKGAPQWGAPFALWRHVLVTGLLALAQHAWAASDCPLGRVDAEVTVSYVFDGDTVKLKDGTRVRFIGINTPEIDHEGGASEPFSLEARERTRQLIGEAGRLQLRYGVERHDRYGRLLAHPFLPDGRSLNAFLLREGLATTLVVPPNTWNLDCYRSLEGQARSKGSGVWSLASYRAVAPKELGRRTQGYRLVKAELKQVQESRNSVWLELEGPMALRIPRKDLPNFDRLDLKALVGHRLIARGWPHYHKGKWRMTIRHPAALEFE